MASHNDPKLLYTINGIRATFIQNGEEQSLTPSGPQTLSLLMVPTNNPDSRDEDFYLHLNLPPELDLPLPATTQIYHQPPTSYLIPRWDMGPDAGAFTKIQFPEIGTEVSQEDVDTFETILAQCTAFLERARPPLPSRPSQKGGLSYNPQDYGPGGKYNDAKTGETGQIVLIDEDDGHVVGELGDDAKVIEDAKLQPGSKDPVEVEISPDGHAINVRPVSEEYLRMAKHPAYKDSGLVQRAATASRLVVTSSSALGNALISGADSFTKKTKPVAKPVEFAPSTHAHVRRINTFTSSAANVSSKTVGKITDFAQNAAAGMAGKGKPRPQRGFDEKGNVVGKDEGYKPGLLNRSMIAFSTVADGIATSGRDLMTTSGAAASTMVGHRWGEEAGGLASQLAGGVKNVGLVYIDVTGVSRRAVIKSVAKGMVVGRVRGGGEVVVGGGDGGEVDEDERRRAEAGEKAGGGPGGGPGGSGGEFYGPQAGEYKPMGGSGQGSRTGTGLERQATGSTGAPPGYSEKS